MSKIRLIISDIDGTILTSNHQVDEQLIEVMPELEKANIPFVLASARSPLGMQPIAHKLGLHDNPIACYNGALVLEGDRTIIQHPVDKAEIQELLSYLSTDYPSVSVNIYSGKSFPSRHVFSATVIAMLALTLNPWLGGAMLFLAGALALLRVLGGVHYPSDVLAGYVIGILVGLLLYL